MAIQSEESLGLAAPRERDPVRRAWGMLLLAFGLFCLLVFGLTYGFLQLRSTASTSEQAQIAVHAPSGVLVRERGLVAEQIIQNGSALHEGDTVLITPDLDYGSAATLTFFDESSVELWPQTSLLLETIRSMRSKNEQQITLVLERGMVRFHIPKQNSFRKSDYRMRVVRPDGVTTEVRFQDGGTYRVRMLEAGHPATLKTEARLLPATEVVVEQGEAQLMSGDLEATVGAGKRGLVDKSGGVRKPDDPGWQLIRDGKFAAYSKDGYNCTTLNPNSEIYNKICRNTPISDTWIVHAVSAETTSTGKPAAKGDVVFQVLNDQVIRPDRKITNVAQFLRKKGNQKGVMISITQTVEADVTPYRELLLEADLLILYQQLPKAGYLGVECPIALGIDYIDSAGRQQHFDYCYYAREDHSLGISTSPWIKTEKIEEQTWTPVAIDLRKDMPTIQRIEQFSVVANGHDYDVQVANISLIAR